MKLYIYTRSGAKINLKHTANTRAELAVKIGSPYFWVNDQVHHVNDVYAEPYSFDALLGVLIFSGYIGFFLDLELFGMLIGALIVFYQGKQVADFNQS